MRLVINLAFTKNKKKYDFTKNDDFLADRGE